MDLFETVFKMFDGAMKQIEDLTFKINDLKEENMAVKESKLFRNRE